MRSIESVSSRKNFTISFCKRGNNRRKGVKESILKFPTLMKNGLNTQSSAFNTERKTDRNDIERSEFDALPSIEEMASNQNYMKNLQPFDMMDRDLRFLVDELKAQKKSKYHCVLVN